MVYLSKSKYCGLWQCPKIAWLKKYKPEEIKVDPQVIARMDAGNEVGDLAMGLFGDYTEVTAFDGDKIDIKQMIENTKAEIEKGTIRPITTLNLVLTIVSLDIAPFIIGPILQKSLNLTDEQVDEHLDIRKKEVVDIVLRQIRK